MKERMRMRISIVDDDVHWIERIKKEVLECEVDEAVEIDTYSSGEQYLASGKEYDISFVDIEMPGIDGFETITKAMENNDDGIYVILTTHTEMSRKGYLVNAFRYIDKAHLEEIDEAINAAITVLGRNEIIEVNVIGDGPRKVVLKNIIYIETEKHYILIHTKQGTIRCSDNMCDLEERLNKKWFCRCHNVFIVNLDEINRIEDRIVYLSNGADIDISHRKMKQFRKLYCDRQFKCAKK